MFGFGFGGIGRRLAYDAIRGATRARQRQPAARGAARPAARKADTGPEKADPWVDAVPPPGRFTAVDSHLGRARELRAQIRTVSPLDESAANLARATGDNRPWSAYTPAEQEQYRKLAATVITAHANAQRKEQ